jgi:hypothetical protein
VFAYHSPDIAEWFGIELQDSLARAVSQFVLEVFVDVALL